MGGVTSVPQVLGGLITRLLYSLIGANYYSRRLATDKKCNNPLELWRGRDYHVYERYGSVTFCRLFFLRIILNILIGHNILMMMETGPMSSGRRSWWRIELWWWGSQETLSLKEELPMECPGCIMIFLLWLCQTSFDLQLKIRVQLSTLHFCK